MKNRLAVMLVALILVGCGTAAPTVVDNGKPGEIKVVIFQDANLDGVLEANEKRVSDRILLSHDDTCPPSRRDYIEATTNGNGETIFTDLKPGRYCVGYLGNESTTTKVPEKVYLSSEETVTVEVGLIVR